MILWTDSIAKTVTVYIENVSQFSSTSRKLVLSVATIPQYLFNINGQIIEKLYNLRKEIDCGKTDLQVYWRIQPTYFRSNVKKIVLKINLEILNYYKWTDREYKTNAKLINTLQKSSHSSLKQEISEKALMFTNGTTATRRIVGSAILSIYKQINFTARWILRKRAIDEPSLVDKVNLKGNAWKYRFFCDREL